MATESFDEKVVVTDPKMCKKMIKDLESQTLSSPRPWREMKTPSMEEIEENTKKWKF